MRKFKTYNSVSIDISIDDFLNASSENDIKQIIKKLVEDRWIKESAIELDVNSVRSVDEEKYEASLDKLHGKWNMLTTQEEDLINKIANRLP